ncbi:LuxR C-terminal-related transcriptional regulator [Ktedonospora formicarum]|uniref:HTH luxR-type domain-containing protein n=1 Tax=Ktedonospora formicarum TaxID=2778364 RepID=A0A8J3I3C3_9CHLR|nr:LuxR C-terminal-related transcriptional regulator [Ktedonospora formicarum]GHO48021.1 hypothetical protein KSX_61840 [Ktedonospora formicarum]
MIKPMKTLQIHLPENEGVQRVCPSPLFTERYLPIPLTELIGREKEVDTICALLQQPATRLLTLTGAGGVGKTHLALHVAHEMSLMFADGICFVSLASVNSVDQVLPAIASAFDLPSSQFTLRHIQTLLHERNCLLLLDNFEHIAGAAPQLKRLLSASPQSKILVTSRTILRLQGEQEFYVKPLPMLELSPLPSYEELARMPAVSLFVRRARTAHPEFELTRENALTIAQICNRLDGLPLALELAALRIKLFTPYGLLERLEKRISFLTEGPCDAPERHQSLRKTIEWSYHALNQEEQRLFRHLSIFAGSYSLHAIEAICGANNKYEATLLDTLSSLLNQSLLYRERSATQKEYRFTMLEAVREYASECLQNSEEKEEVAQAHAEYYLSLTQIMEFKNDREETLQWIRREFENLRSSFSWFLSSQEREQALRMRILELHSPQAQAICFLVMGAILATQKRYIWAIRLWGKARALTKEREEHIKSRPYEWLRSILGDNPSYAQMLETIQMQFDERDLATAWTEGESLSPKQLLAKPESSMVHTSSAPSEKETVPYFQRLTPREREVLRLLTLGLSSAVIARQLFVSLTTVNSHVRTIYNKLGVSSRSAATRYALEHHLV